MLFIPYIYVYSNLERAFITLFNRLTDCVCRDPEKRLQDIPSHLSVFTFLSIFFELLVSNAIHTDPWDEDRLISGLKQGQENAFRALIHQYQGRLFGVAFGITQDREESLDIVQDVFLKVFQHIGSFEKKAKLSTWLRRITVNHSLNIKRRWLRRLRWHHRPLETEGAGDDLELGSERYGPEVLRQRKESELLFREKLKSLPLNVRTVFTLKELEGLSYEEIARTLKISRGTVSSRLFYARQKLKASLADNGEARTTDERPEK